MTTWLYVNVKKEVLRSE